MRRFSLFVLPFLLLPQGVYGQSIGKESLSHLNGVAVWPTVTDEAQERGLLQEKIKTNTELQLRKAGIEVYSRENLNEYPASPALYILITTEENDGLFALYVQVQVRQTVSTVAGKTISASTYETIADVGTIGANNIRDVADKVRQKVRIFINDWLAVHE